MSATFDRVRPRVEQAPVPTDSGGPSPLCGKPETIDLAGRSALYSTAFPGPGLGHVAITCPKCAKRSVVGYWDALWLALPSLHLPILRGSNCSWMRCPACRQRGWVALTLW